MKPSREGYGGGQVQQLHVGEAHGRLISASDIARPKRNSAINDLRRQVRAQRSELRGTCSQRPCGAVGLSKYCSVHHKKPLFELNRIASRYCRVLLPPDHAESHGFTAAKLDFVTPVPVSLADEEPLAWTTPHRIRIHLAVSSQWAERRVRGIRRLRRAQSTQEATNVLRSYSGIPLLGLHFTTNCSGTTIPAAIPGSQSSRDAASTGPVTL
ncbi:hypothetical protein C8Q73DRAFT_520827 [Cubamyces lactineus]|nr:hypothetical protein C8Q73DRAFT_520827 [Cubamyces lactineus]